MGSRVWHGGFCASRIPSEQQISAQFAGARYLAGFLMLRCSLGSIFPSSASLQIRLTFDRDLVYCWIPRVAGTGTYLYFPIGQRAAPKQVLPCDSHFPRHGGSVARWLGQLHLLAILQYLIICLDSGIYFRLIKRGSSGRSVHDIRHVEMRSTIARLLPFVGIAVSSRFAATTLDDKDYYINEIAEVGRSQLAS